MREGSSDSGSTNALKELSSTNKLNIGNMLHPLVERLAEAKVMEIMNFREWANECADSMAAFSGTTDGRSLKEI